MSHYEAGPLAAYNSLQDPHLQSYHANTQIRKHLIKSGLVSKHGDIISENRYRLQIAKKEHRKNVKDMLATAIVHKALDMERMRQYEIRKRLDELYKIDVVQRVKAERTKKSDQELIAVLSPRSSSAMQKKKSRRKARKQLQHETLASATKLPSIHPDEKSARVKSYIESTSSGAGEGSQQSYQPRPPKSRSKKSKGTRLMRPEPPIAHKIQLQSMAEVTMKFLGSPLNLASDMFPMNRLHEVTILQQHSGGSTLCVFREMLPPNTVFTFISRRHRGSPFGLTMNIGNICNARLSTCCEYKHKCGFKVGGKHSQFALISVHGAAPCYRCQIRLNLLEPNKTKTEEHHSDESDAESAVRSYDVIVSRNAQYPPPSPEPSTKEKEPARPPSASAATQTTDNEEAKEDKETADAEKTDEFHLPDKEKYSSGSEDDSDEDLSDDDFDEEALTRTEEDNGSGSESESESEEDDIDEQEQLSGSESQTETENLETKVASDDEDAGSSSASSSDSELEELKDDEENTGTANLAEPVDAVDARPGSAMIAEAVIATTNSEDEEDKEGDAKVDSDDQKYDEEFENKSSSSSSSSSDSESEKEEDKDEKDDQDKKEEEEVIENNEDETNEEVDSPEENKETPELNTESVADAVTESSEAEQMASTENKEKGEETTDAPVKLERPSSAVIIRDRPSSGILSSRPNSSRSNSSGSKKNVTFNQDIQVETYEKVDVPTITTVSTDEYSEDDGTVADLPEDSEGDDDLAGDDFAGERIVVLQDLADTTDEEASNRSGEEQTTDEEKEKAEESKDVTPEESTSSESESSTSEEEINKEESKEEESEGNEPELDLNESEDKALEVEPENKNVIEDVSEMDKKQGIFEYGQLHYSHNLELIKPKDETTEDAIKTEQEDAVPDDVKEETVTTEEEAEIEPVESSAELKAEVVKEHDLDEVNTGETSEVTGDPAIEEPVTKEDYEELKETDEVTAVPETTVNTEQTQSNTEDEKEKEASTLSASILSDAISIVVERSNSQEVQEEKRTTLDESESILSDAISIIAERINSGDITEMEKTTSDNSKSILSDAISIIAERINSEDITANVDAEPTPEENKEEPSQETEEQEGVTSADEPVTSDSEAEAATFDHGHEFKPTPDEYEVTREKSNENLRSLIKSVKDVEINSLELDDNQTRELAEFLYAEADEIESLSLRNTTLSGVSREIFEKMEGLSKLKMLNLNMCNLKFNEMRYLYDVISSDECSIQTLLLHGNPLGDAGIETLIDGLMKNTSIASLNIGGCSISDEGIVKLAEWISQSKTLTDLTLSENISIGKQGWQALAMAVEQNQSLETLAVDFCELKDEGCTVLSAGVAKSTLKSLDIEGNQITDQGGASLLEAIQTCASLRDVTLTPQNLFSEEMEDRLKDALKET